MTYVLDYRGWRSFVGGKTRPPVRVILFIRLLLITMLMLCIMHEIELIPPPKGVLTPFLHYSR
jgi:hypothetical protein